MVFNTSFLAFIQGLKLFSFRIRRDDDSCDRLNHHHTALFLLITSILISSKQYVGNPIHCWVPKEFSKPWQKYADSYCWIKNTYIIPPSDDWIIPKPHERSQLEINYYQWVPIVLLIQSLLFYFPAIIWRILNWIIGINVQDMITKAMDVCSKIEEDPKPEEKKPEESIETDKKNPDESKKSEDEKSGDSKKPKKEKEKEPNVPKEIRDIAHHLEVTMDSVTNSRSSVMKSFCQMLVCSFGSRKYGCYLLPLYLFTKILYIINVIGQLFLLNSFIGTKYSFFGFQILNDLVKGNDWKSTGHFPRVTMCDFEIRNLGQRTNYTVQCVLPINLFNEKIYIFIWFWIFIVSLLTVYSFFQWIVRMASFRKLAFIKNLLVKRTKMWTEDDNELLKMFLNDRLKTDGVFLIYLVYLNSGDLVTKELLDVLWFRHKQKYGGDDEIDSNEKFL